MFTKTMLTNAKIALSVAVVLGAGSAASANVSSKHVRETFAPAWSARAMVPSSQVRHSSNRAFDVHDTSGRYIGSDPDPFIRSQLARDPHPNDS
jgi:hypothetical protein